MLRDPSPGAATHETVTFVEFEYAGYNPRGFDLGNFFCEMAMDNGCDGLPWPGFCMDPGAYPSAAQRARLLRAYARAAGLLQDPSSGAPDEAAVVAGLRAEADAFMMASHLRWALWAACMSAAPATDEFGYLEYGLARLGQYYALKAAAVAADDETA